MKILSNFDTNLSYELYNKYVEKYWQDNVLIVFRCKIYLFLYVLIPAFFTILILVVLFWIFYWIDFVGTEKWYAFWIISMFVFILTSWKLLKRYIDYKMDFSITTPDNVIYYEQTGFFTRESRTLNVDRIKSISVEKDWILRSLFNFWNIKVLSEWDISDTWHIHICYIYDPDARKWEMQKILNFWKNNTES